MSEANPEVVRRLFAAFDDQDWEAALGLIDPEIEWSPIEGATYRGTEGVLSHLAEWMEPWEQHQVEFEEVTEVSERVLAVIHVTGRGAGSGMEVDQRFFQIYEVRGGKVVGMVEFVTREEALDAAAQRR